MNQPRFTKGQRVRIADRTPPVHHRVPSYVKGQVGLVERVCGMHPEPRNAYAATVGPSSEYTGCAYRRQIYGHRTKE